MTTKANAAAAAVPLASGVSYFPFGPMTAAQLGNGINEAWSYDLDQRLTQISAGSVLNRTFAYTLRNQIATDGTANYLYDAVGRLTLDQPIGGAATTYSYDANGNRLTRARPAVTDVLTYQPFTNQLNQVVSTQTAGSTTGAISRDARGATTRKPGQANNLDRGLLLRHGMRAALHEKQLHRNVHRLRIECANASRLRG